MSAFPSGPFAIGDDLTRHDPGAEPRNRFTAARPRPRREVIPVINVDRSGIGPNEARRRYAAATELLNDGAAQVARLDAARDRETRLTAMIADASRDTGGDPGGMARRLIAQGVRL